MRDVNGFVFQRSYFEAMRGLDAESRLSVLDAMMNYAFTGEEPSGLAPVPNMCFVLIKPTLDASLSRYAACRENGKKGGRPRNQNKTKEKPKQNLNTNKDSNTNIVGSYPLQDKEPTEYIF